jgi:hypothetical protein
LSAPTGEELGSAHIDRGFEHLAKLKLKDLAYRLNVQWDTTRLSHAMRFSRDFQESKMELTMEKAMSNEYFTVAIPNINPLPAVSNLDDLLQRPDRLKFYWYVQLPSLHSDSANVLITALCLWGKVV